MNEAYDFIRSVAQRRAAQPALAASFNLGARGLQAITLNCGVGGDYSGDSGLQCGVNDRSNFSFGQVRRNLQKQGLGMRGRIRLREAAVSLLQTLK